MRSLGWCTAWGSKCFEIQIGWRTAINHKAVYFWRRASTSANPVADDVSNSSKSLWYKNPSTRSLSWSPLNLFTQISFARVNSWWMNSASVCSRRAHAKPWQKILKAYMMEKWVATQNVDDNASKAREIVTSERFSNRPHYNAGFIINGTA